MPKDFAKRFDVQQRFQRGKPIDPFALALNESEHSQQVALFAYAAIQGQTVPAWRNLFAIPNGGARDKVTAARMKAEGVKRGVPDVLLAVPCGPWHGLFIELKRETGGRVSEEQMDWHGRLHMQGYCVQTCKGFVQAKETIENYLALSLNHS